MLFKPRNILVTGGAGFIGSNFIRILLSEDCGINKLINLDLLTYAGSLDNLQDLPENDVYQFIQGDIQDAQLVENILHQHQIDTIIHFAAESHVDRSIEGPAAFIQTNILGTFVLLEAAKKYWLTEKKWDETHCRFHHVSTDEVYGSLEPEARPFTEKTAYAPNSPYSASKASSDHLVRSYHHTYGLPITMSHCSNNYGSYQHAEKFIPTIIRACREKQPIPVYGDGSNIRDWIYVDDHCLGILAILRQGKNGETYNLGGNCEMSNIAVAHEICALMDTLHPWKRPHDTLIQFVKDRPGHDWRYAIDSTHAKMMLAWESQTTFIEGMKQTIPFFMKTISSLSVSSCHEDPCHTH